MTLAQRAPATLTAVAAAGALGAVGAAQGGYFAPAWGWGALTFAWIAALALLLRARIVLSTLEVGFLAALGGLLAWTALSIVWSASVPLSVGEVERDGVYVSAALALLVWLHGRRIGHLLGGLLAGVTLVCAYGLATKLLPDRLGTTDPARLAGNRLFQPVGYWNALGLLAAMGAVLAVGLGGTATRLAARAAAAAALVVLLPTLYFTFSRGAWVALAIGLGGSVAIATGRRLRLVTIALVLAVAPAATVVIASRSSALTSRNTTLARASHDGHRLALALLVLALLAAAIGAALPLAEARVRTGARFRRLYGATLAALALAACGVVLGLYGANAYDSFTSSSHQQSDLNRRLLGLSDSGRSDLWSVAWRDVEAHPALGSGAGTFERAWYAHRASRHDVRAAHNLYLQTLAELGPAGLLLLVAALALPLAAAVRAREQPLVAPALGLYVAYLAHAAYDWDWQMPVVTLAALGCGCGLLVAARHESGLRLTGRRARASLAGVAVALGGFGFVVLVGSGAAASDPSKAASWAPWSAAPWRILAENRLAAGDRAGAADDLRQAIAADPGDYRLWLELSYVTAGAEQRAARRRAVALNPLLPQELGRR